MNNKVITIGLGIGMIFYVTSYNYAYFVEDTYQDNRIKIEKPLIEEDNKHIFQTTATIDGETFDSIIINLEGHFTVDTKFKLSINNKYGIFENKFYTLSPQISHKSVVISLTKGDIFNLSDFGTEPPSSNKLDVIITYREDEKIYEKEYTVDFIRHDKEANLLKVYFCEDI